MIEVREVTKVYGKKAGSFQALRGVSFEIPLGSTVAIIGKSGSGKSTLMHLMGGLDRPSGGDILIRGRSMSKLSRRAMDRFRARDLGFVFQSFFVEPNQSCHQNVALPLEINGVPMRKRKKLVQLALLQVGLSEKANAKARTLSGGQKQRLAIARAIVNSPKILMADEPTGNLDSVTGDKIIALLFGLNQRLKSTLIVVTHDADLAARCQYQVTLKDGLVEDIRGPKPARQSAAKSGTVASAAKAAAGMIAKPAAKMAAVAKAAVAPAKPAAKPPAKTALKPAQKPAPKKKRIII